MKGGYINIDCSGLDLPKGSTVQIITGLYQTVKSAFKAIKPIFVYNTISGVNGVSPIQVYIVDFDTYFVCNTSTLQIKVTNQDKVTITNLISQ